MLKLLREVRQKRRDQRNEKLRDFAENFKLYREATAVWLVDSAKVPIEKMITNKVRLQFNNYLSTGTLLEEDAENRIEFIKSLVEDFVIDIDDQTIRSSL